MQKGKWRSGQSKNKAVPRDQKPSELLAASGVLLQQIAKNLTTEMIVELASRQVSFYAHHSLCLSS